MGPPPGVHLPSAGGYDGVLGKPDSAGEFTDARGIGGAGDDEVNGLAITAAGGPVIAGSLSQTLNCAVGPRVVPLQAATSNDGFVVWLPVDLSPTAMLGRHVFYNQSYFDGNSAVANAADDGAIATDKTALLPGQTATLANYRVTRRERQKNIQTRLPLVDLAFGDYILVQLR